MRYPTFTETEDFVKMLFPEANLIHVYVSPNRDPFTYMSVELESSDSMSVGLKKLMELSRFFGTLNIDETSRYKHGGCSTCDYGAVYHLTFVVKPDTDVVDDREWKESEW